MVAGVCDPVFARRDGRHTSNEARIQEQENQRKREPPDKIRIIKHLNQKLSLEGNPPWNGTLGLQEEHTMTTPEQALLRRRPQILNDYTKADAETAKALDQDDHWVGHFIAKLDALIRKTR